jgi:hypothetical protein
VKLLQINREITMLKSFQSLISINEGPRINCDHNTIQPRYNRDHNTIQSRYNRDTTMIQP